MKKRVGTILTIVFLLMALSISIFMKSVNKSILEREMWHTQRVAFYISKVARQEIFGCEDVLATVKEHIGIWKETNEKDIQDKLLEIRLADNRFYRIGVMGMNGMVLYDDGYKEVIHNPPMMEKLAKGEDYVSDQITKPTAKENTLLIAVPYAKEGKVLGALIGYYDISQIDEAIGMNEESLRYFRIIDAAGNYISESKNKYAVSSKKTLKEQLLQCDLKNGVTSEEIIDNLAKGRSGTFYYVHDGDGRYVSYEPLGMNRWYIFSVLVEEQIDGFTSQIGKYFHAFVFVFILLAASSFVVLLLLDKEKRLIIQKQNNELLIKNKMFDMMMRKTQDIPFEINLAKKKLTIMNMKGDNKEEESYCWDDFTPKRFLETGMVSKESYDEYRKAYDSLFAGGPIYKPVMYMKIDEEWHWFKVQILHVNDDNLVGFLENYDTEMKQKRIIEKTNRKLMIDELTGLYRRESFINIVKKSMRELGENEYGALMILDLDGFKNINDSFGHYKGDLVLQEVAEILRSSMRKADPIGRLGGDEFVIYMNRVESMDLVARRAGKLNEALQKTYEEKGERISISASIGIAFAKKEDDFQELYQMADEKLYEVKEQSKNHYLFANRIEGKEEKREQNEE